MDEAKHFVSLIKQAIQKGVFDSQELTDGESAIPMRARGQYEQGERYARGDVVYVQGVGLFVAKRETVRHPSAQGNEDWLVVMAQGNGGGGAQLAPLEYRVEQYTPVTNGQTAFTIAATPQLPATVVMNVNGVDYHQFGDFALVGLSVTWSGPFTIAATDRVVFRYV